MRRLIDEGDADHDNIRYIDDETLAVDNGDSGEHRPIVVPSVLTDPNQWSEATERASDPMK